MAVSDPYKLSRESFHKKCSTGCRVCQQVSGERQAVRNLREIVTLVVGFVKPQDVVVGCRCGNCVVSAGKLPIKEK